MCIEYVKNFIISDTNRLVPKKAEASYLAVQEWALLKESAEHIVEGFLNKESSCFRILYAPLKALLFCSP